MSSGLVLRWLAGSKLSQLSRFACGNWMIKKYVATRQNVFIRNFCFSEIYCCFWFIYIFPVFAKRKKQGCSKKRTIGAENRLGLGTPMLCPPTRMLALMRKSNYWASFGHPGTFLLMFFSLVKMQHEPQKKINKQLYSSEKKDKKQQIKCDLFLNCDDIKLGLWLEA